MKFRIDLKIIFFLLLFFLTKQLYLYILIMLFCLIHECSHILIAKFMGFKIKAVEIMPFGFFTNIQAKIDDYNIKIKKSNLVELKKIGVVIAGPLSNLIIIAILLIFNKSWHIQNLDIMVYSNLIIFMFNMLPIYPLDGGRLCKSIIKICFGPYKAIDLIKKISNTTVIILTVISSILILYLKNWAIVLIIIYLWGLFRKNQYN